MTETLEALIKEYDETWAPNASGNKGRTLEIRETGQPIRTVERLLDRLVAVVRPEPEPELIVMYAIELEHFDPTAQPATWVSTWSTAPEFNDPEAEWQIVTVCPHEGCEHPITRHEEEFGYEVDRAERLNTTTLFADKDEVLGMTTSQGDGDYHTIGWKCGSCEQRVSLPAYFDNTWS